MMNCWGIFSLIFASGSSKTKHHKTTINKRIKILIINILTHFYLYFPLVVILKLSSGEYCEENKRNPKEGAFKGSKSSYENSIQPHSPFYFYYSSNIL
jgi:hypothetical protein